MTNSALLAAINHTIKTYKSALDHQKLSVCVVYRLVGGAVVTNDYHATRTGSYDAAKKGGVALERRACALLDEHDVTPDCHLIKTYDGTIVGVAIGGQADITIQGGLATTIATEIVTRYQEFCQ
ncbi:MAG TPA: hypothetical protein VFZ58_01470 [Candidatus Saccharimonadales bacterium]